ISWIGDKPGDYLTGDLVYDSTKQPLLWDGAPEASLRLDLSTEISGNTITYFIYPFNLQANRMWDLKINVPIPTGTTFLSSEATAPFVSSFDGQEVTFTTIEFPQRTRIDPLRFSVTLNEATPYPITTKAWANWKISSRRANVTEASEEQTFTGDIVIYSPSQNKIVTDQIGDVPFANYDLANISLQNNADELTIVLQTVAPMCPADEPLELMIFIDSDCRVDTGFNRDPQAETDTRYLGNLARVVGAFNSSRNRGSEYDIRYRLQDNRATLRSWNSETQEWSSRQNLDIVAPEGGQTVAISIPYNLIDGPRDFCWSVRSRNRTEEFVPSPPADWIPDTGDFYIKTYTPLSTTKPITSPLQALVDYTDLASISANSKNSTCSPAETLSSAPPTLGALNGKIAIPLYNDQNSYDVHVFTIPSGQEIAKVANARQPNFRSDGQKMLVNREDGGVEDLYEYNFADSLQQQVGNGPQDSHPFYDKDGNRVVFGNAELTVGADGKRHPFIFVQCGLMPPYKETEERCKNLATFGVLVPAGQTGDLQGSNPVWTNDDQIAFKGCDTWAGSRRCGIYLVPSTSTKGFSDGFIPTRLTDGSNDIPSDTSAGFVTFTSQRDGDWEAYVVNLDGSDLRNLSNSPTSSDGLPTVSPDGSWVAFVSDRGGSWAVWVTSLAGGEATKLFDLPDSTPWGAGADDWLTERISWGP
ncbi:MAG: PD40 domain-containing protein, partial [Anaerolineae bacterium]|nr:PD40 domain-containing protein [Anaerolineae bacterium]